MLYNPVKGENWKWKILIEKCKIGKIFTSRDYLLDFKEPEGTFLEGLMRKLDLE